MDSPAVVYDGITVSVFSGLMLAAAFWDAWTYRIPNLLTGLLAVAFFVAAMLSPDPVLWLVHLAGGLLTLGLGSGLFAWRIMGGGDVKLLAAGALWFGFAYLPMFLVTVALLGGALALVILVLRRLLSPWLEPALGAHAIALPLLLQPKAGVPFGIAIGVAGILLAPHLPILGGS